MHETVPETPVPLNPAQKRALRKHAVKTQASVRNQRNVARELSKRKKAAIEGFAITGMFKYAAAAAGVSEDTLRQWRAKDPTFSRRMIQAKRDTVLSMQRKTRELAENGNTRAITMLVNALDKDLTSTKVIGPSGEGIPTVNVNVDITHVTADRIRNDELAFELFDRALARVSVAAGDGQPGTVGGTRQSVGVGETERRRALSASGVSSAHKSSGGASGDGTNAAADSEHAAAARQEHPS